MMRLLPVLLALLALLALLPDAGATDFDHKLLLEAPVAAGSLQLRRVTPNPSFTKWRGELSSIDPYGSGDYLSRLEVYVSSAPGPKPLLLILPPFRGTTFVDGNFAEFFARKGFVVARMDPDREQFNSRQPPDFVNRFLVREVRNLRALISSFSLDERFNVDTGRVAVLGFSLGGIRAAVLGGVDNRVRAAVLVVAGGDLPGILASTKLQHVVDWRRTQFARSPDPDPLVFVETDPGEYSEIAERRLRKVVQIEPLDYARQAAKGSTLLLQGQGDEFVRDEYQLRLLSAYRSSGGQPRVIRHRGLLNGHYPTIFASYTEYREDVLRFVLRQIRMQNP